MRNGKTKLEGGRERQNKDNEIEERRIKTDRKRRIEQPEAVKAFEPSSV